MFSDGEEPPSSSVPPKVIVPSITVVSLLVLITFIGAVVIFVRSYKKKRRHPLDIEKQDSEAGEWGNGTRDGRGSVATNGSRGPRGFGGPSVAIKSPPRAADRRFKTLSQESSVSKEFYGGKNGGSEGVEVVGNTILESSSAPAVPIGKIERITGNALSNDFYSDRASGCSHSRGNSANVAAEPKHHSNHSLSAKDTAPAVLSFRPLIPGINLSPISPVSNTSAARDFAPGDEGADLFKYLSSPPPAVVAQNATALEEDVNSSAASSERSSNISSSKSSSRFSYTQLYLGTNLGKHISAQYNRLKEPRRSPQGDAAFGERVQASLSPAFDGFPVSQKPSRFTRLSSESTSVISSVEPAGKGHSQRISWSGRSVLELDTPVPSKQYNPISPSQAKTHILRRTDRNLPVEPASPPKFATSPKAHIRRHTDYPPPPPIPADPSDVAGGPGDFILPMPMFRSFSNSKMSVVSVPSTISSVSTFVGRNTIGGLSPTPARHSMWNTPNYEDVTTSNRKSVGASTVLTETSETSNMTEIELEMEMRKIGDRARRASEERRGTRRRNEENQGVQRGTEVIGMPRIGHRFF
ncbi:hypothetical protein Q9L58_004399 [Maublancomyces gigas]|uniref:Uncharacterized protein n=1 Tax=Discina gigas TaxID=1032678 RepID=A0ABR3GKV7_9PEZI